MGFITNNANILLLFLIITSAVTLVAATVFFQTNFDRLNKEYQEKLAKLNAVSRELETQEAILKKVKEELTLKSVRESDFTEKYTSIRDEKQSLETTKKELETKTSKLESDLDHSAKQLMARTKELESKENTIQEKEAQISQLNKDVTLQKLRTKKCENDLNDCQVAKAKCTCP